MGKILEPYFIGAAYADYLPGPVPGTEAHDTAKLGIRSRNLDMYHKHITARCQ
jgi:hypothetical protein